MTKPDLTDQDLPPMAVALANLNRWIAIGNTYAPLVCLGVLFLYTVLV